jgi:hypothetical protein
MKNKKFNLDQFAKFIAYRLLEIKNYNFDVFYDIKKIVELKSQMHGTEKRSNQDLYLMLRDTGCDLIYPNDPNYQFYLTNNSKIYKLEFCFNSDYFSNEEFCKITTIKL